VQLSGEDSLKLNVLLHNDIQAIRIHESSMTLYALSASGEEAKVPLSPNCPSERYLKYVREMLSGHVLGSPGGYPVFLKRWTRMGQAKDESLADLLMLGEPEAVVAVANAPGLTDELARRAWWADPIAENARRMLTSAQVVQGSMGKILAEFLVEHLAFETEPQVQIDTVRLVLQPGLIDEATRQKLWVSGARKNTLRIGFLQADADNLPEPQPDRPDFEQYSAALVQLATDNPLASLLHRTLDSRGQGFLKASEEIMKKPANQDVVVALLNTVGDFFAEARLGAHAPREIELLVAAGEALCSDRQNSMVCEILDQLPQLRSELAALLSLAHVTDELVTPIFAKTTAEGTLMRRKLEPITGPLLDLYRQLRKGGLQT